jgi:lipopolysaccharide export system protein LptA
VNSTRRVLRLAIRVLAGAFLVVVALSYKKPGTRTLAPRDEIAATLAAEARGVNDRVRFRGFDYVETRSTEGLYRLRAAEALGYEANGEQIFRLKDVVFESREEAPGHAIAISAPRAEFARTSRAVRVFEGVRVEGEATVLHGESFRYDPKNRTFLSEGKVTAMRGALVARALGGRLDTLSGVLLLSGDVRMRGRDEAGRGLDLAAPSVTWSRRGEIAADGGVLIRTEESVLRSRRFLREDQPSGDRVRAEEDVLFLVLGSAAAARPTMLAAGKALELVRDADGQPAHLELWNGDLESRLDTAPTSAASARVAFAKRVQAGFVAGRLSQITTPDAVRAYESAAAGGPARSGLKSVTAGFARFTFQPDGKSLDIGVLERDVVFTDGTRVSLTAPHGTLRGADKTAVFSGNAAQLVSYRDPQGALTAENVAYDQAADRVDASGRVRATYGGERKMELLGGATNEPLYSESATLRLENREQHLTLTGKVRAWQGENVLRSASLQLDDVARLLRAEGDVHAFFRRKQSAPGSPAPKGGTDTVNASGDLLTYREADRFVRIDGKANVVSGVWTISSDATDIRLAPDRTVEYAEARGAVRLEDRELHRRGEGSKATWRPATDAVTLDGTPAVAVDGKGNRLTGAVLTFRQGRSRVDVQSSEAVGSEAVLKPEGS